MSNEEKFEQRLNDLTFEQCEKLERRIYEDDTIDMVYYTMVIDRMIAIDEKRFIEYEKTI